MLFAIVLSAILLSVGVTPQPSRAAMERPGPSATNPTLADPVLGPEVQISTLSAILFGEQHYHPSLAYNAVDKEFLAVFHRKWEDGSRSIIARRLTVGGRLVETVDRTVGPTTGQRFAPAVAYSAKSGKYLIVWMYDPTGVAGSNSPYEIWGSLCNKALSCGTAFKIFSWGNRGFWTPRVAWNSYRDQFMVIWNAFDTTTGLPTDVAGVHVTTSGVVDAGAHIITAVQSPHQADIVYNMAADEYVVVCRYMWTAADGDIWGALVKWDGSVQGTFVINNENVDSRSPAIATNGQNRFLVVWQHQGTPGNWYIVGQYLDITGTKIGPTFPIAISGYVAQNPKVASNGSNEYMTTWEQITATGVAIRARRDRVVNDVTAPIDQFEVASGGFWNNAAPAIAAGGPGYLMAYEGISASNPTSLRNIYVRSWAANGLFLPLTIR